MKVFNLMLEERLHFAVKKLALELSMTMHEFILTAIKEKIERGTKSVH
jgi:hypothetical protein